MCSFEGIINTDYSSIAQSVEHSAVNRVVVGSSPTRGVRPELQYVKVIAPKLRCSFGNIILKNNLGSMVKRLRHRPFTAVTRVRFPLESSNITI